MTLYQITFTVNLFALLITLWLGLYLVTRNPRAPTAWLTALTLWSLGGLFINILLALNPPPVPAFRPPALRFLFPFWPSGTFVQGANAWLQGWSVAPAIAFWHHTTMLMRPGKMNPWRWTRVLFGYLIAIAAIEVQAFTQILFSVEGSDLLYLNSLRAGPLYGIFGLALIALAVMCIINLARSAYVAPNEIIRRQLVTLAMATFIAGLIVPVSLVSSGLDLFPMPMVVMSGVLTVFVGIIGYGVARYSALVQKRIIDRDFFYNLSGVMVMAGIYIFAAWILILAYEGPKIILIFFPLLGVITHTGLNAASIFLDWFFYRGKTRDLRAKLHDLRRLAGESENLRIMLEQILASLCARISATYGLILTFETNGPARPLAQHRWKGGELELPSHLFTADDFVHLSQGRFSAPLHEAALLVPLYIDMEQLGALVLGRPANGLQYVYQDVEFLLYPADQIADASPAASTMKSRIPVDVVDQALKRLFDYAYLADCPLAELDIIRRRPLGEKKTHIERGKALQAVIMEALEKMKPRESMPREPISREWYPYVILYSAYVQEVQNRDIMSKLYISEGTFNRTRRAAISSLARVLVEMDHSA